MNGKTSGFVSGAASGAALGAEVGGVWGGVVGGVVGGVAGLFSGGNNDAQFEQNQRTAQYNAMMQYNTATDNAMSRYMLNSFNAVSNINTAQRNAEATKQTAEYNANIIKYTTEYNNSIINYEEELLWDKAGLDLANLKRQRDQEKGNIIAGQASSGVIIGDDKSTGAVVINSMTEGALDAFVIRHQADINYADLENKKAQNTWEGQMNIQKVIYDGAMSSYMTLSNAKTQSASALMSGALDYNSAMNSASSALTSANWQISNSADTYSRANTAQFVDGLYRAGNTVIQNYDWAPSGDNILSSGGYEDNDLINNSFSFDNGSYSGNYYNTWGE